MGKQFKSCGKWKELSISNFSKKWKKNIHTNYIQHGNTRSGKVDFLEFDATISLQQTSNPKKI